MNNSNIESLINDTIFEFSQIEILLNNIGVTSPMAKYLTLYSLIKATGVIEFSYKTIVADFHSGCSSQLETFIDKTVRSNSKNPNIDNMHSLLKSFDDNWDNDFKTLLNAHSDKNRLMQSLSSLNQNRNKFAHGISPTASFNDIKTYFNDAVEIVKMIDSVVV